MDCDFMKLRNWCDNYAYDCRMSTRASLFFKQYPDAPHRNGIPYAFPCLVDKMTCDLSLCKPDFNDSHCWLCAGRYWLTKICDK